MGWIHAESEQNAFCSKAYIKWLESDEAKAIQEKYAAEKAAIEQLTAYLNKVGQYIKVGDVCLPFSFYARNLKINEKDGVRYLEAYMHDCSYQAGSDNGYQEFRYAYRRIDAADNELWLTKDEFFKK